MNEQLFVPYDFRSSKVDLFPLRTHDQLRELQSTRWIVKRLIPMCSVGVIFGASKAGKTFLAIDLGAHVAHGLPVWFGFPIKAAHPVVYVPLEGRGGMLRRADAWAAQHGCNDTNIAYLMDGISLQDAAQVKELIEQIQRYRWPAPPLVFIDTLAQAAAGLEENSSQMSLVLQAGQRIAYATGGAVCFIAHPGHSDTTRLRGWSGMPAGFDFSLRVDVCGKRIRKLVVDKVKDDEDGQTVDFELLTKELNYRDEDGATVTSLVVVRAADIGGNLEQQQHAAAQHSKEDAQVLGFIVELVRGDVHPSRNYLEGIRIAKLGGISQSDLRRCINRLVGDGKLVEEGRGKHVWLRPIASDVKS